MLDLNMMNDKFYEVRLLDGKQLKLGRPTQKMYEQIMEIQDKKTTDAETLRMFARVFAAILNRNTEHIKFNANELSQVYDFAVIGLVIKDYFSFWNKEIKDNINFQ